MNEILGNVEALLDTQISGFHQYSLTDPVHLTYVSQNFCDMLGHRREELLNEYRDLYAPLVHPLDRDQYDDFLRQLAEREQTLQTQYRIIPKNGLIKYVSDTATSSRLEDGTIVASSVLTDITSIKEEQSQVPWGFVRYTCEKQPRVTYVNDQMLKMLRFPDVQDDELDFLGMYKENVYMMIPIEQRRKFSVFLKRVYSQNSPISGELVVQRCDGTRARLHGWVSKCVNADGQEEFQTVCMDITENYKSKKAGEIERYLQALTDVYDKIFEYDFGSKTAKCLHAADSQTFGRILNIPMHMEDATEHYVNQAVVEEDRPEVRRYLRDVYRGEFREAGGQPTQIQFRARTSDGQEQQCSGIFIKLDSSIGLFCCRTLTLEADSLRSENESLKNMIFTRGNVAFQVEGDRVKPLYSSENICKFFGYTSEEWTAMSDSGVPLRSFISCSGLPDAEFMKVLETGEAEFNYMDLESGQPQRIKAVCSDMFAGGSKYVMLYKVASDSAPAPASVPQVEVPQIRIRTFGYFDVFVGDSPIAFRNKKSKELFALLVDRRGGFVSSEEAISFLWEDEPVNAVTLARYRKVAMRLKNILEEYGIADVVEAVDGKRRIVTEKVSCDLYDYLSHREEFAHLFKGSYLTNYSWGETTLGELYNG